MAGAGRPPTAMPRTAKEVVDGRPSPAMTQGRDARFIQSRVGTRPVATRNDTWGRAAVCQPFRGLVLKPVNRRGCSTQYRIALGIRQIAQQFQRSLAPARIAAG